MTEDVFKVAINANPADMALRLVFADWLEEEGRCIEAAGHRWLVENGKVPSYDKYLAYTFSFYAGHHGNVDHLPINAAPKSPQVYGFYAADPFPLLCQVAKNIGEWLTAKVGSI